MIQILVVDDEQDVGMLIGQRFRRQIAAGEYAFTFARDGIEALELLDNHPETDIVLSDINMPRMDGLTLLGHIRERNTTTQVLMVSAYGDMANIRTAMNRGAFDFVVKPIDFQDLQLTIAKTASQVRQLRAAREELRRIDALKDQFLANTSHELRTPLHGIIGLAEAMQARLQYPENQDDISMIIASGRRLSYLVDDILDVSRLRNADIALQRKPVHLRSMAEVVVRTLGPLTAGKQIELRNEIPEDLPAAFADENRLLQVFFNLAGNAVKFTPYGEVRIGASLAGDQLEVFVADTGIGIAEAEQAHIFQEFRQTDASLTRSQGGAGLGLPISHKLVELHGGTLRVSSRPGEGATFYFTLPISEDQPALELPVPPLARVQAHAWLEPQPPESSPAQSEIHILVVDDEPVNQQVIKNHLSSQRFRISQALNGPDALRMLAQDDSISLVLLDVMMPRMSGYEVCARIRQTYLPAELPVIMVTAKNQVQDLVQGLSLGASDYLAKPFSREELLARIYTQLDLHRIFEVAGRFVPNEFIRALGKARITEVARGDQVHREVTVLFSDIRDYTTLSESMTPEENFGFINAFHGRQGPVIQANEGFVNQYLGDGIMALFPRSAADALNAAIQMHQTLGTYNESRLAKGRSSIRMGIGLHTGPLIMGIIGDAKRLEAATISDTVNTAARIESLTKSFRASLLLSERSFHQLADPEAYHVRFLGPVQVKGRTQPVNVFECFDPDSPQQIRLKQASKASFEEGIQGYFGGEYALARKAFAAVCAQNPADQTAHIFEQMALRALESQRQPSE